MNEYRFYCLSKMRIALIMLLLTTGRSTFSQEANRLEQAVDQAVHQEMHRQQAIGAAVGILLNHQIAYIKPYGLSDRENQLPVTRNTMFRWASISKSLTAITILQLAEQGLLDLDQDIHSILKDYPLQKIDGLQSFPITIRQLLCHQGGIVHYTNGVVRGTDRSYLRPHPYRSVQHALNDFNQSPLLHPPASEYAYSTRGYILLSAIAEKIGGQRFHKRVHRTIAKPLGMQTLQPDFQWKVIPHRTIGYRLQQKDGSIVQSTNTDVSWKLGGGGFISNIDDLAKFAQGLMQHQLVRPETERLMWQPNSTTTGKLTTYGLGFRLQTIAGRETVGHSGSQEKTKTRLSMDMKTGTGVVLMCNSEHVDTAEFATVVFQALSALGY